MDRYTHLGLYDQAAALDKLPELSDLERPSEGDFLAAREGG